MSSGVVAAEVPYVAFLGGAVLLASRAADPLAGPALLAVLLKRPPAMPQETGSYAGLVIKNLGGDVSMFARVRHKRYPAQFLGTQLQLSWDLRKSEDRLHLWEAIGSHFLGPCHARTVILARIPHVENVPTGSIMHVQSEPITMWFDRRLVLRPSPIHGVGTFTVEEIAAGQLLMVVTGGLVVTTDDRRSGNVDLAGELYNQETLAPDVFVITPKVFHYYINHACAPNAIDVSRSGNATQYIALRDIRAQEEITADYYDVTTLERCLCNAPNCRWTQGAA